VSSPPPEPCDIAWDEIRTVRGIHSLVLSRIATSGVVLSTLGQAVDLDFALTVLSDGCADPDDDVHRVLMEKIFPSQAQVMTVNDWTRDLAKPST